MGLTLKAARVNCGLNQEQAAKLLGISVYTVSNYERGKSYPDAEIIKRIEDVYVTKYDDLIFLPRKSG